MAKRSEKREKPVRLVENLLSGADSRKSVLEVLGEGMGAQEPLQWLQAIMAQGIRRLGEQGDEGRAQIPEFVAQVFAMAKNFGVDPAAVTSQAVAALLGAPVPATPKAPKRETRELILTAALQLFGNLGYHATTIEVIAEKAGLGKGTVYHYFPTKDDLFQSLIREKWNLLLARTRDEFMRESDLLQAIRSATRVFLEFFEKDRKLYRLMLKVPMELETQMRTQYMEAVLSNMPLIKERLIREAATGKIKLLDFHTVFYGYLGFMEGAVQKWLRNGCRHSLVGELDTIMETMLFGFVANEAPERERGR